MSFYIAYFKRKVTLHLNVLCVAYCTTIAWLTITQFTPIRQNTS